MNYSKGSSRRSLGSNRDYTSGTNSSHERDEDYYDNSSRQGEQSQQKNYFDRSEDQQSRGENRGDRYGDYDQSGYSFSRSTGDYDYDYDEDRKSSFGNREEDEDSGLYDENRSYSQGQLGDKWRYDRSNRDRWQSSGQGYESSRGESHGPQGGRSSRRSSKR